MPRPTGNWQIKKTTVVLLATVAFVILATMLLPNRDIWPLKAADEDILNDVEGYWWAPNGGWIILDWDTVGDQDVQIDKSTMPRAVFTGYAWGPNIGWVSMQDTSGGNQYQLRIRENIDLKGPGPWPIDNYAWGPNIGWLDFDAIDTWDHQGSWHGGPISADEPQLKVNATVPEDADMAGYAWSPNIGWIDLSLATVPGWRDTTAPELRYFDVLPENGFPLPPTEKYAGGVYKDKYDYQTPYTNFPGEGHHFAWVKAGIDFKVIMHSADSRARWHSLNISELAQNDAPPPDEYFWWDRIRFRPGETPNYTGYPMSFDPDSGFNPNTDYADGSNPAAMGDVPPDAGDTWKSVTHFTTSDPIGGVVAREFRYNLRDAAGNRACSPAATFSWQEGKGCVIPSLADPSPMYGRAGIAIDNVVPSGQLFIGEREFTEDEPVEVSATKDIVFDVKYIDTEAGSYRVILEYRKKAGEIWPADWSGPIGERRWNLGRDTVNWTINGILDPGAETETEVPLDTEDWIDGQEFELRLQVIDNVGNVRERILPAIIKKTAPDIAFIAEDPIDQNRSRTRYNAVDLELPLTTAYLTMGFSNNGDDFSDQEPYKTFRDNWPLDWPSLVDVTGGVKTVWGRFCDGTIPVPVCRDFTVTIKAPWFEGAAGDVYGGGSIGTRGGGQLNGIAPYYTVTRQKFNATYRITAAGEIKPQITSQQQGQAWKEGDYEDFGYPGPEFSIAQIDFDDLWNQATAILTDKQITNDGGIDFNVVGGLVRVTSSVLNTDPELGRDAGGEPLIFTGSGTLLVDGNLRISTDLYYRDQFTMDVSEVDSLAVLTKRRSESQADTLRRGNVYVAENVSHLVGAYVIGLNNICPNCPANDALKTGVFHSSVTFASGGPAPALTTSSRELVVEGMVAARDFNLGRYSTGNQNFLNNADLDPSLATPGSGGNKNCPSGWTCTSSGIDTFVLSKNNPVSGLDSLQINLIGGQVARVEQANVLLNPMGLDQTLTFSGYVRAVNIVHFSATNVSVAVAGGGVAQPCALTPEFIDYQWRRFQCTTTAGGAQAINLSLTVKNPLLEPITLDLDALQLENSSEATTWHTKFTESDNNYMASERFYYDGRVIFNTPPGLAPLLAGPGWGEAIAD